MIDLKNKVFLDSDGEMTFENKERLNFIMHFMKQGAVEQVATNEDGTFVRKDAEISFNEIWLPCAELKAKQQATPEGFVLDAPARVGGGVFRKGVKWKTVIESAQRLYEHSKDEIKPIVSPADMLKIANGELVLVPRDQITCFYQDNDEPENFCNSTSGFDSLGDCIDLGDIMQINKHKQANISTEKLYGTWVADTGNPLERSRYKFFVGTEFECEEIVLENERVFEEAQEQSHD